MPTTDLYPGPDKSGPHSRDLLKICFNIILPSTPRFSEWYLFLKFSNQSSVSLVKATTIEREKNLFVHFFVLDVLIWGRLV
jgi:hypothetical protein